MSIKEQVLEQTFLPKQHFLSQSDQRLHFRQLKGVLRRMELDWESRIEHVDFGMLSLPEGKLSTRRKRVVFLDEPTTGLDPQARRNFWDLVQSIQSRGTTVILTTHYMDEAHVLCDEIAIMDNGKIVTQGSPDALLRDRFAGVIIELPVEDVTGDLAGIEHRVLENLGVVEIVSTDIPASLTALSGGVANIDHIKIRQPNLEDLFLDLTGHLLRA